MSRSRKQLNIAKSFLPSSIIKKEHLKRPFCGIPLFIGDPFCSSYRENEIVNDDDGDVYPDYET